MSTIAPPHRGDPFFKQMFQAVSTTGGQFYIRMEDEIRLSVFTTTASLTVTLEGILLDLDGDAKPFNIIVNPTSDGVRTSKQVRVGPGFVLYCEPRLSGGTPAVGNTTVVVEVVQSDNATAPVVKQVAFGTLTATGFYPYQDIANTVAVSGTVTTTALYVPTVTTVSNPAAGAEWTTTVPAGQIWEFKSCSFKFVASATVANRFIGFLAADGAVYIENTPQAGTVTAGMTIHAVCGNGIPFDNTQFGSDGTYQHIPTAPFIVTAGMTLGSNTRAIDATDQFSNIRITYNKYTA